MKILFQNESEPLNGTVTEISDHLMEISGVEQNLSGFYLCTDYGDVYRDCTDFVTLYRSLEDSYQLSNDGSTYSAPEYADEIEPTLDELKTAKIYEMEAAEQNALEKGIDVDISTGTEHFPLGNTDMMFLIGLQSMVLSGQEQIPWHNGNENEPCKFYSNADMKKIQDAAMGFVIYQETKIRDLTRYINSLTDKEAVKAITYDTEIPSEYHSEVMQTIKSGE